MTRSDCCGIPINGPDLGEEAECRDCDKAICTQCAAVLETEGGYGDYGLDARTKAICWTCYPVPPSSLKLTAEEAVRDALADFETYRNVVMAPWRQGKRVQTNA
jgi:hypothetical protein